MKNTWNGLFLLIYDIISIPEDSKSLTHSKHDYSTIEARQDVVIRDITGRFSVSFLTVFDNSISFDLHNGYEIIYDINLNESLEDLSNQTDEILTLTYGRVPDYSILRKIVDDIMKNIL